MSGKKQKLWRCFIVVAVGILCIAVGYAWAKNSSVMKKADWQGTFQLGEHKFENGEYIAITPSFENKAENVGKFQWYAQEVLHEGTYQITEQNYLTLYENEKSIGIIFSKDKKYYFVDDSLEVQKLIKTADEPSVLKPIK